MDFNELSKRIERQRRELEQYVARKFPVKAGAAVKSIVQENFRKGGFQDGARFTKWAVTKRQFIGPSETVNSRLQTMIETDLTTILTK